MIAALREWGQILCEMAQDEALLDRAAGQNEWFTPFFSRKALLGLSNWWSSGEFDRLAQSRAGAPSPRRIGLILAGNVPLVGLHDLLMTLLSGHVAVVKPSHKDTVLLEALLARSAPIVRSRIAWVSTVEPDMVDGLVATGSNVTARSIAAEFRGKPLLLRHNRYSVAMLDGTESDEQLKALADDVLAYHGMGCRSVSSLLVPEGWDPRRMATALDAYPKEAFSAAWQIVLRHGRAVKTVLGQSSSPCSNILFEATAVLGPVPIGSLAIVPYKEAIEAEALIAQQAANLQCLVGPSGMAFGCAQSPGIVDFADKVDTLAWLTDDV